MAFWKNTYIFGGLSGNQPASYLDSNFAQLSIAPIYASGVSGTNIITLNVPADSTTGTYQAGMTFIFTAIASNTSGVSLIVQPLTGGAYPAVSVVKNNNEALVANDIVANGAYQVYYDGTNFHLMNPTVVNVATQNKIINPEMVIDQRFEGTGNANPATGEYTIDRWNVIYVGVANPYSQQRSNDTPSNSYSNSLLTTVVTQDNAIAAGDLYLVSQRIEGYNIVDLIGNTFTFGFWVKSSLTGVYGVSFRNSAGNYSYVATYTINVAATWEYKTITVTGGLTPLATWLQTNGLGINLSFALAAGTTYQTTAGTWNVGNFVTTGAQTNWMATIGNQFRITGVQLCLGSILPRWESRQFGDELALCQRYYQKSYVTPGTVPGTATTVQRFIGVQGIAGTPVYNYNSVLPTPMRASPTVTLYNPNTGTAGSIRSGTTNPTATATGQGQLNTGYPTLGTAGAVGDILSMHYTAEAEL